MERVIAYIDGSNLYFGLKSKNWRRYYWLNVQALTLNLLKLHQSLEYTKYFTSRLIVPPGRPNSQAVYLEALGTLRDFQIHYGKYQLNPRRCDNCGFQDSVPSEKMTDVNIAVELLADAFQDRFDTALLISADADLVPPVRTTRRLFPAKRVVVAMPPNRNSVELTKAASAYFRIDRRPVAKSLFPPEVRKPDGFVLKCPPTWR